MSKLTLKGRLSLETQAKLYKAIGKDVFSPESASHINHGNGADTPELVAHSSGNTPHDHKAYLEKIKAVQEWLEKTWPGAFNLKSPKPLKRRIENDIVPHMDVRFTKTQVRQALTAYTSRVVYLQALLKEQWRYDLSGEKIEEISESQKEYTREKLNSRIQKNKGDKKSRNSVKNVQVTVKSRPVMHKPIA